ncbi:MAG: TetR/AcrR family transcriptional regulator [Agitococcus sp.]|nr:TetR/AcrR family transcriptional regulator [Agitococcus sp.]
MARNKRDIDRKDKQDEIIVIARALFLAQGYEATSMAQVARDAGVAPNTLYWYFTDKDDLLIAVLNGLVLASLSEYTQLGSASIKEQFVWFIAQLEQSKRLVLTVHARIEQSQAVQLWHSQFHQMLDHLIIEKLIANGLLKEQAVVIATAGTFIVEGLLTHPHSAQQRDSVIDWIIAQTFSTV